MWAFMARCRHQTVRLQIDIFERHMGAVHPDGSTAAGYVLASPSFFGRAVGSGKCREGIEDGSRSYR
jgi:hypothetical protein